MNGKRHPAMAFRCAALLAAAVAGIAPVAAAHPDTPADRYDIDLVCAIRMQTGLPIGDHPAAQTRGLADLFAKRVEASGRAIGKTPAQIAEAVRAGRADMLRTNAKGPAQRARIARIGTDCAALPIFEMIDRAKGKAG